MRLTLSRTFGDHFASALQLGQKAHGGYVCDMRRRHNPMRYLCVPTYKFARFAICHAMVLTWHVYRSASNGWVSRVSSGIAAGLGFGGQG